MTMLPPVRRLPVASAESLQRESAPTLVGRIHAELGVREDPWSIDRAPSWRGGFSPTSHFTESMLFHAYRCAGKDER